MLDIQKSKQNQIVGNQTSIQDTQNGNVKNGNQEIVKPQNYFEQRKVINEEREKNRAKSKFFSWKDRREALLRFVNPEEAEPKYVDNKIAPKNEDGTYKKRLVVDFQVHEVFLPSEEESEEQTWRASWTTSETVAGMLEAGYRVFKITKTGTGMKTEFHFVPESLSKGKAQLVK
jgi:hypothetical protein